MTKSADDVAMNNTPIIAREIIYTRGPLQYIYKREGMVLRVSVDLTCVRAYAYTRI